MLKTCIAMSLKSCISKLPWLPQGTDVNHLDILGQTFIDFSDGIGTSNTSDSESGCLGTQRCRKKVPGVLPNIEVNVFLKCSTTKRALNYHFQADKDAANFFSF